MSYTKFQLTQAGIFVITGLVGAILAIYLLSGKTPLFRKVVQLNVQLSSVQGLASGSIVSIAGLRAGNVDRIELDQNSNHLTVIMNVFAEFAPRITEGSIAEVRTAGALGDKYLYITPGSPTATPLPANGFVKAKDEKGLLDVVTERGNEIETVFDILNEVKELMKRLNDSRPDEMIGGIKASSDSMTELMQKAGMTMDQIKDSIPKSESQEIVLRLRSILTKIDDGQGTLGKLVNDDELHERLQGLLGGSKRKTYLRSLIRTSIREKEANNGGQE